MAKVTPNAAKKIWDKVVKSFKDFDFDDIESPPIKKGRPKNSPLIEPNPIELGSTKNNLELGDMSSSDVPLNEFDLGKIDQITLKPGRPSKPTIGVNEKNLGSTKNNLELGDAQSSPVALNELDMPEISQVPAISGGTSLAGGGRVPTVVGEAVDEMGGSLAKRSTTIPTEVGAQVMGKGPKYTDKAGNIMDAEIVEKTLDSVDKMPEGPLKQIALKQTSKWRTARDLAIKGAKLGTTAAVIAGVAGSGSDGQSPSNAMSKLDAAITKSNGPVSSKSSNYNDLIQEEANNQPSVKSLESQQQNKPISKINQLLQDAEGDTQAKDNRLNYMELMQNAQQSANQNQLGAALLKADMQAGAAIAGPGAKADYSLADSLAASADKPVSNVKGLMETDVSSKKLKQIQDEMNDEDKMRDPNSEISKFYREQYGSFLPGINSSTTAFAMNKAAPGLIQLHNTREAAKSRESVAKENAMYRAYADKKDDLDRKERQTEKSNEKLREFQKLNPKQGDVLTNLDNAEAELKNVIDMLGSESSWVGPLDEMVPKTFIGDKQAAFRSATGKIEDVYRHAVTGAGAGKAELSTLRERVPNIGDSLSQFKSKATEALADIQRKREIQLNNLKKQGKDISAFETNMVQSPELTTKPVSSVSPETQEKLIAHVMRQNGVDRDKAVNALKKAGKL